MSAAKCIGILGRLFGHRFTKLGYDGRSDHCLRCGMPMGGWKS